MLSVCLAVLLTAGAESPAPTTAAHPQYESSSRPQAARGLPGGRPVAFVLAMGFDRGGEELIELEFTDGSSETLRANGGFYFAAGGAFLSLPAGRGSFDTLATFGVKGWRVGADDGGVSYLAFPVEVIERFAIDRIRLGLGVSWLLAPRLSTSGVLAELGDVDLKKSLGIVTQLEWIGARASRAGYFLGARFVLQKLEAKGGTGTIDANAFGIFLGMER